MSDNANKLIDNLNVTVTGLKKDLVISRRNSAHSPIRLKLDLDNLQNAITNLDGVEKGANTLFGTADTFIGTTDKQLQEQSERAARDPVELESDHDARKGAR